MNLKFITIHIKWYLIKFKIILDYIKTNTQFIYKQTAHLYIFVLKTNDLSKVYIGSYFF